MSPYTTPSARSVNAAVDDLEEGTVIRRLDEARDEDPTPAMQQNQIAGSCLSDCPPDLSNKQPLAIDPVKAAVVAEFHAWYSRGMQTAQGRNPARLAVASSTKNTRSFT